MTEEEVTVTEVASEQEPDEAMEEEAAGPQLPTIGRIVHYHSAVKVYPAIVAAVYPTGVIDVVAFGTPFGSSAWRQNVREGGPRQNNTWSWPPREGDE